jgi:hypothetical protein
MYVNTLTNPQSGLYVQMIELSDCSDFDKVIERAAYNMSLPEGNRGVWLPLGFGSYLQEYGGREFPENVYEENEELLRAAVIPLLSQAATITMRRIAKHVQ